MKTKTILAFVLIILATINLAAELYNGITFEEALKECTLWTEPIPEGAKIEFYGIDCVIFEYDDELYVVEEVE